MSNSLTISQIIGNAYKVRNDSPYAGDRTYSKLGLHKGSEAEGAWRKVHASKEQELVRSDLKAELLKESTKEAIKTNEGLNLKLLDII